VNTPAPGWYADPHNGWQYRYWDGMVWTEHTAPAAAAGPTPTGAKIVPPLPFPAVRAEFGRRALGYIVDWLVIVVPLIIVFGIAIFAFVASVSTTADSSSDGSSATGLVFILVLFGVEGLLVLGPLLYNGYFTSGGRRTVGQRVAGLRVVHARTGDPLTLGWGFLRALVAGFGSGQLFGLGYWWALWDGEHRTWHDMATTSVVIDERQAAPVSGH